MEMLGARASVDSSTELFRRRHVSADENRWHRSAVAKRGVVVGRAMEGVWWSSRRC